MLFETYKNFITKLIKLLFPWNKKVGGRLSVSAKGALEFKFYDYPENIEVFFTDSPYGTPCNPCDPGKEDELDWQVRECEDHYILRIHWDVSGMRNIEWIVES